MSARSWQELLPRHEAFLNCVSVDRPLFGAWLGGYYPAEQFPRGHGAWQTGQPLEPADVRCAAFGEDYEQLYRLHREADDDFFYVGSAYWGVPWLEAILGCPIRVGTTSCWAAPRPQCSYDLAEIRTDVEDNAWFRCLAEFSADLLRLADGRFPVCPPLLRGPVDAACALCGSERVLLAIIDGEAWVRELLDRCAAVRGNVLRELQQRLPAWEGTYAAGGYPSKVWSARTVSYYQDDSASLLSPKLFRQVLYPLARRTKQSAEVRFVHLHSSCLYMLDTLLADDTFSVIEVNLDLPETGTRLPDYLPQLRRVQQAVRPLLLWGEISAEDWRLLQAELRPAGLSVQPIIQHPDDIRRYVCSSA